MQVTEFLLPHAVRVHDGLDVDAVGARFEIFEALQSGDVDKVHKCMSEHTGMARDSLLKKMWSSPKATP